jgi:hypothetical protein
MPKCKNDKNKSYIGNEPSPKGLGYCAHAEIIGKRCQGFDKNIWEVKETSTGVKRWVKKLNSKDNKLEGHKKYFIHSNGSRPYLVYVKKLDVHIYKIENESKLNFEDYSLKDEDNLWMYTKLVKRIKSQKVFIGNSPKIEMTKFSGGYGKKFDGNTILLLLKKNNYVLIDGDGLTNFTTKNDEIKKYYSFVGNNNVTYPMAIGEKNYYFWTYPNGYMDKSNFPKMKNEEDIQLILNMAREYDPFLINLKNHKIKSKVISLEEFKEIQQKPLNEISTSTIKELANLFSVTTSGSKKELADRIKKLRGVVVYSK